MAILLVGLGNPGKSYDNTRHNLGFALIDLLADRWGISLKKERKMQGELGVGAYGNHKVLLLKPTTYMNLSGESVRKVCDYYKTAEFVVIVDDVHLPFGKLRLLEKGGTGGHNGLKNIELHMGTKEYKRLRIGVGGPDTADLSNHVLGKFTAGEREKLTAILMRGVESIEQWLDTDMATAMKQANTEIQ